MNAREQLALRNDLTALGTKPLQGSFYRIIDEWYRYAPLSIFASHVWGTRYNRAALYEQPSFGALYLANSPAHALVEINAIDNGAPQELGPRTLLTISVTLQRVADLRDSSAHTALGVTFANLTGTWRRAQRHGRTITQEIGAAALDIGLEGLLVPSACVPDAFNLVVIEDNMLTTSLLQVYYELGRTRFAWDSLIGHK